MGLLLLRFIYGGIIKMKFEKCVCGHKAGTAQEFGLDKELFMHLKILNRGLTIHKALKCFNKNCSCREPIMVKVKD